MITENIQKIAASENFAALGFAPASEMAGAPAGHRPEDLLPGARGLISFAVPLPRAVYRTPVHAEEMVCRSQSLLYRRLDSAAVRIAALLEEEGEQALPVFGCSPMEINRRGDVAGYLNQIRMGAAAGIGVIGRNGLLIHSRYGSRLMLGGVVTTARAARASPRRTERARLSVQLQDLRRRLPGPSHRSGKTGDPYHALPGAHRPHSADVVAGICFPTGRPPGFGRAAHEPYRARRAHAARVFPVRRAVPVWGG